MIAASIQPEPVEPEAANVGVAEAFSAAVPERPSDPPPANPVGEMHGDIATQFAGQAFEGQSFGGVPRISIHMFCELGETAALGETALRDRRLARAAGAIFSGGLPAALGRYRTQPTPSLVIVESLETGANLLSDLDRLAEVCDASTKVMVIGRANDIALYRELMRRGVSEYLVGPLEALQLIGAVSGLYEDPSAPFAGRSVAVIGAKGGVGASVIAHNLAYALSEKLEANTILVDLDLPFGAAGLNFNQDPLQGVANALVQPDRLDPVLLERMMARCSDRLSLFAAPATLDDDYEIGAAAYAEVTQKIKGAAPFVVLDLPHLWSAWVRHTLLTADEAVVVATPDLASLRNAKNLIELMTQGRPNDDPPRLVLNQVGLPGRPEISVKDFAEAVGVQPALVLPFDAKLFGQAANNGQMIEEVNAKAKTAEGINHLARLIGRRETAPSPEAKPSALAALFKRK
ncbi:MAG: pilus assembly protein CpaE [Caulobacteraceae bacterium]|nr:pilus assembly protein CpaE [Caulobacteraceae bacterium]